MIVWAVLGCELVMMLCFRGWGFPEWISGFSNLADPFQEGHLSYCWGHFSRSGWRSYFIAAFLVKTPLPFLVMACWGMAARRHLTSGRLDFLLTWCLWPVALIFVVSSLATIQVGIRHILPVYPFLCLWVGSIAAALWDSR